MPSIIVSTIALLILIVGILIFYYFLIIAKYQKMANIIKMIKEGNYNVAIKNLKKIIEKNTFDYEAHKLLADAYYASDNIKLAVMEYRIAEKKAKKMPPNWEIEVRQNLGDILYKSQDWKEALEEYSELVKLDDRNSEAYYRIGKIYTSLNLYQKAVFAFRMALKIDVKNSHAYLELGKVLYDMHNYTNSIIELENCIKYDVKNYKAYYWMGLCYKQLGDLNKAIESFNISDRDKEISGRSLINKSICLNQTGNGLQTIDLLTNGLKKDYNWEIKEYLYYYLAEAYEFQNNVVSAIDNWEIIFKKNPKFKDVSQKLEQYSDLRNSDEIKDYMTSPLKEFVDICHRIVKKMSLIIHEVKQVRNEEVHLIAKEETKVVATKPSFRYMIMSRASEVISEDKLRNYIEIMKKANCHICVVVSTSNFLRAARVFSNTRPIELVSAKELSALLES